MPIDADRVRLLDGSDRPKLGWLMTWSSHSLPICGATALVGLATLVGCSGTVVSASDASTASTLALLSIESSTAAGEPATFAGAHASAYFLRMQAGADPALATRLVGTSLTLPALGQCAPVELLGAEGMPLASLGPVDLVDVGQVALEGPRTRVILAARAFPDVIDLVSGVVYTTRDPVSDPMREPGTYTFRTAGTPALAAMKLDGRAPGSTEGFYAGGSPLGGEPVALPRANVAVSWQPVAGADLVYVELASLEDGPLDRVRCAFAADGTGLIPVSALPKANLQSLTVHALHRESVVAPGLDGGEMRFDLAVSGTIRFDANHP
jgi:hypothetical protein